MITKVISALIAIVIFASALGVAFFVNQRESLLLDGQIQLPTLQRPVQIYFDQLSIPYIEASSEKDLTIAQGFVTASQRLFQMDLLRRTAKGDMSIIFGSACLPNDRLSRILGFKRIAEAEYTNISPETKKWLKSYCQGVNAYISQGKLPLEFILLGYEPQPWQPEDTLAILKYLQYASDECWQINILQDAIAQKGGTSLAKEMFGSSYPEKQAVKEDSQQTESNHLSWQNNSPNFYALISQFPQAAKLSWGSTGWVIAQALSASQGSLLACSKDTLFSFPDLFLLTSLRAPFLHVAGITIPGVPGIIIGRNDHIAWTAISLKQRSQELIVETFSDKYPDQYQNNSGHFKAKEIQEDIPQRFAPDRLEKVTLTKDGPLLTKTGQVGVALHWYGFDPNNNSINALCLLNKAHNWTEFSSALEKYNGSPQTFLYTDTTGNIAQYIAGYNNHLTQSPNSTNQTQTDEVISTKPDFIIANNSQLSSANSINQLINTTPANNNWAVKRAAEILKGYQTTKAKCQLEDIVALLGDTKAPLSTLVSTTITKALIETNNIDQYDREAAQLLTNWDGQLKANSTSASIYESFLVYTTKKVLQEHIGQSLANDYINNWPYWTQFTAHLLNKQNTSLIPADSFAIFNLNCLSQSLKNLRLVFGSQTISNNLENIQWQKLHQLDFCSNIAKFIPSTLISILSPFLPPTIGVGGDQDCLNTCNFQISDRSPLYNCNSGPTARLLIDMADNDKFYHSLILGQSGHLFSNDRISNNQLKSWQNMEFHAIAFSQKQLERVIRHHLSLKNTPE